MTSSLVGSEMCIRDSFGSLTRRRRGWNGRRCGQRSAHALRQLTHQHPVSYTHLTLPTICSV
eukprot:7152525-Prorocentrum_lima.AAC.1